MNPEDACGWAGSSPQVRGTPEVEQLAYEVGRLIPAGAGNTTPAASQIPKLEAHPRRCGEHLCSYDTYYIG